MTRMRDNRVHDHTGVHESVVWKTVRDEWTNVDWGDEHVTENQARRMVVAGRKES
jgi:uncharacterized protein with HEPN domain